MASKLISPFSKSPAYQLWTISLLAMLLPPLIGLMIGGSTEFYHPAQRLIYFCGFFVLQIENASLFDNLPDLFGYTVASIIVAIVMLGIIAMWFMMLALPAFNRFSMKKRFRLHVLQFVYSSIQVVAGAIVARDHF